MDALADLDRAARALGDDDHEVRVAGQTRLTDASNDVTVKVHRLLRHQDCCCAGRQTDIQRQMARIASHDLDDRAALVRLHGVAQAVDRLDRRIGRRIKADRVVRADNVIVDRRRDTDDGNALLGQLHEATERAVTADGDDTLEAKQLTGRSRFLLAFQRAELVAARGIEHRAAAVDDMCDILVVQHHKIAVDQAIVTAADADAFDSHICARAHDRPDRSIHAGSIAAGGKYANALDCSFHIAEPSFRS